MRYRLTHPSALLLAVLAGSFICLNVLGFARAQDTLPGVPAQYVPVVTLLVSLLAGLLIKPLTAIVKRLGGTSGVTTVAVSAGLSLLVVISVNLWQAWATRGSVPWPTALFMALLAFVQANGAYLAQVAAAVKGAQVAGQQGGSVAVAVHADQLPGFQPDAGTMQPLFSLPSSITGMAGGLLSNSLLETAIKLALASAGVPAGAAQILEVAAKLAPLAPDLFTDGNAQLSTEHLALLSRIVLDLKGKYLGGTA